MVADLWSLIFESKKVMDAFTCSYVTQQCLCMSILVKCTSTWYLQLQARSHYEFAKEEIHLVMKVCRWYFPGENVYMPGRTDTSYGTCCLISNTQAWEAFMFSVLANSRSTSCSYEWSSFSTRLHTPIFTFRLFKLDTSIAADLRCCKLDFFILLPERWRRLQHLNNDTGSPVAVVCTLLADIPN